MGIVCVQWALLEHLMLGLISSAESSSLNKVYISYGGLDMLPRIGMALKLARFYGWPGPMIARIEAIRKEVQGHGGLGERRNQLIHGVHKASLSNSSVSLTMVRWGEPKRTQDVSIANINDLARRLGGLAYEAGSIFDDYGVWKFGANREEKSDKQLPKGKASVWLKIAQDIKGAIKRLFGNL